MAIAPQPTFIRTAVRRISRIDLVKYLVPLLLMGIFSGLYFFFESIRLDGDAKHPARIITEFLADVPTEPFLYLGFTFMICLLLYRYWNLIRKLHAALSHLKSTQGLEKLSGRDWWVIQDLRKRSLGLRVRADFILLGIFMLLLGGIYVVLFVLAEVRQREELLERTVEDQLFKRAFAEELQAMEEGRYWMEVKRNIVDTDSDDWKSSRGITFRVLEGLTEYEVLWSIGKSKTNRLTNILTSYHSDPPLVAFSEHGEFGLVGVSLSRLYFTKDGGELWKSFILPGAWESGLTELALSPYGALAVVANKSSEVYLSRDGGEQWRSLDLQLKSGEWIVSSAFSTDELRGYLVGDEGSLFVTEDGGRNWVTPAGFPSATHRWEEIVISRDGKHGLLVSGDGAFVVIGYSDKLSFSLPLQMPAAVGSRITHVGMSPDGQLGVVAGEEGPVYFTRDAGEHWEVMVLNLGRHEWIEDSAFNRNGKRGLLVGDEGLIVKTSDSGASWASLSAPALSGKRWSDISLDWSGNKVQLLDQSGVLHVSSDFGRTWQPEGQEEGGDGVVRREMINRSPHLRISLLALSKKVELLEVGGEEITVDLPLRADAELLQVSKSREGSYITVSGSKDTLLVSGDGGESWRRPEIVIKGIDVAALSWTADGTRGLIVSDRGEVFVSIDGGEHWALDRQSGETLEVAGFSEDGSVGYLIGIEGGVLATDDGGESWARWEEPRLMEGRWHQIEIGSDGTPALVFGWEGRIGVSWDGGQRWLITEGLERSDPLRRIRILFKSNEIFAEVSGWNEMQSEAYFLLGRNIELEGWEERSARNILRRLTVERAVTRRGILDDMMTFSEQAIGKEESSQGEQRGSLEEKEGTTDKSISTAPRKVGDRAQTEGKEIDRTGSLLQNS